MSFPGIGITKTPYYRMHEESKKAKLTENRTKHLNDLKFGIFPKKIAKIKHYSLENIKKELFQVYRYKNELEENHELDAISKKLRSIIRADENFWGKSRKFVEKEGVSVKGSRVLRGLSTTDETTGKEESRIYTNNNRVIFTKSFKRISL